MTFTFGFDFCPNGLLKIFLARPNTKCGIPFPKSIPIIRYAMNERSIETIFYLSETAQKHDGHSKSENEPRAHRV
jgi:hypothetical protein